MAKKKKTKTHFRHIYTVACSEVDGKDRLKCSIMTKKKFFDRVEINTIKIVDDDRKLRLTLTPKKSPFVIHFEHGRCKIKEKDLFCHERHEGQALVSYE